MCFCKSVRKKAQMDDKWDIYKTLEDAAEYRRLVENGDIELL